MKFDSLATTLSNFDISVLMAGRPSGSDGMLLGISNAE